MTHCIIYFISVIILVCGQTNTQLIEDVLTYPNCPLCCDTGEPGPPGIQGPTGNQGVPGKPGIHGLHGEPGIKGEVGFNGFKGRKGERGPKGDQGGVGIPTVGGLNIKGDPGQKGGKGEIGTSGSEGPTGPQGNQGAQGQKGQKGRKGGSSLVPIPAFFVKLKTVNFTSKVEFVLIPGHHQFVAKRSADESIDLEIKSREKRQIINHEEFNPFTNAIPFDDVVVNVESGWKPDEHIFRAPTEGTYLFSATIYKHKDAHYVAAVLYKNHDVLASTIDDGNQSDSATLTAIAKMTVNDVAWVKLLYPGVLYATGQTTFSGVQIH